MTRILFITFLTCFTLTLASDVHACSCKEDESAEFLGKDGDIPATAQGVIWYDERYRLLEKHRNKRARKMRKSPDEAKAMPLVVPSYFKVERKRGEAFESVELTVTELHRNQHLIAPEEGLLEGETYRFRYVGPGAKDEEAAVFSRTLRVVAWPDPAPELTLEVTDSSRGSVDVAGGSRCRTKREDVQRVSVEVAWPEALEGMREQWLYETLIDGERWQHQHHLCASYRPGTSWKGHGRDQIFFSCPEDASQTPDIRRVTMQMRLPGGEVVSTSELEIDMGACSAPVEPASE